MTKQLNDAICADVNVGQCVRYHVLDLCCPLRPRCLWRTRGSQGVEVNAGVCNWDNRGLIRVEDSDLANAPPAPGGRQTTVSREQGPLAPGQGLVIVEIRKWPLKLL